MNLIVEYNEIKSKPVQEIEGFLKNHGKPLKEVTIFNLIENNGVALNAVNGVYVFHDYNSFFYIGKCSSRSFVERIPSHFDIRPNGWFNTLLKYLCDYNNYDSFFDAAMFAKNNLLLVLITMQDSVNCSEAEKLLRLLLRPKLNPYKGKIQNIFNKKTLLDNLTVEETIATFKQIQNTVKTTEG
jgi:hypothetical protein